MTWSSLLTAKQFAYWYFLLYMYDYVCHISVKWIFVVYQYLFMRKQEYLGLSAIPLYETGVWSHLFSYGKYIGKWISLGQTAFPLHQMIMSDKVLWECPFRCLVYIWLLDQIHMQWIKETPGQCLLVHLLL